MTEPVPQTQLSLDLVANETRSLVDDAQRLGLTWDLRPATVRESGTRSAMIVYDGDDVPVSAISLIGPVVAGIRVYGLFVPPGGNFLVGYATKPGFVDGVNVATGTLAGPVSAETNLPQLALSGPVKAGYTYLIKAQIINTVTITTDDWGLFVRRDTALTGTIICQAIWSGDNLVGTHFWGWSFTALVDEDLDLFFSVVRIAGTGTITVLGQITDAHRTMAYLDLSAPSSLWRTT